MSFQLSPDASRSLDESLALFGRHATGWRTHAGALTKQEVFAKLAVEGVRRGFVPIGEYEIFGIMNVLSLKGEKQPKIGVKFPKEIDLVWARRAPARSFSASDANQTVWDIVAAFEIEGYDNGSKGNPGNPLKKDVMALAEARLRWGAQTSALVLFSVAYDRNRKEDDRPHPSYQDTKNAASWHAAVRTQIATLDAELRRHPEFSAHTGTPVLLDADLDRWLAALPLS